MRRLLTASTLSLLLAATARAHEAGLSRGEYRVRGREVEADLVFARRELAGLLPGADADHDGDLGEFELLAVMDALHGELADAVQVAVGEFACTGGVTRIGFVEEDGLGLAATFTCPPAGAGPLEAVTLRLPLLARLGPGHRHIGQLYFLADPEPAAPVPEASPGATGPSGHVLGASPGATGPSGHVPGASLSATGPSGHVPGASPGAPLARAPASPPLDFLAHAQRSALTIRRPTATPPSTPRLSPPAARAAAPTLATPPARGWLGPLGLGLAALGLLIWRRRRA